MRKHVGVMTWLLLCGCLSTRVELLPSLTPIDATRPFSVYEAVKGTACGDNAVANAMNDLYRVGGDAHGFVSATLEQQLSGDRCVTITARPITYGCAANEPRKLDVGPMRVVPGTAGCAEAVDTCTPECARYGTALGGGEFETKAFRERCVTRCHAGERAFMTCARAATAPTDVRRCDATP